MSGMQFFSVISVFYLACVSSAFAERAWEGHIHLVDSNVMMVFDGYDYGTWDDVGRLDFPARGRASGGAWSVAFRITPDDDNPLQATIHGTIELVVDEQKAVIKELRFVRKHKHADWQMDPRIIEELKNTPNRGPKGESQPDTVTETNSGIRQHSNSQDALRGTATATLLDADLTHLSLAEAQGRGWEFERVSLSDEGLFLNGRYEFGDDGYRAVLPIEGLDYSRLSFSIEFQGLDFNPEQGSSTWLAQAIGHSGVDPHTNLITGGTSYRWFSVKIRDGHLWLTLNNGEVKYLYEKAAVTPREWHTVSGSIDLAAGLIYLMLDGELVAAEKLPKDFAFSVVGLSADAGDRQLTFTDYSNSESFHGYVARVTVLDNSLSEQELREWYQSGAEFRSHLPRPVQPGTVWALPLAVLVVLGVGGSLWWQFSRRKESPYQSVNERVELLTAEETSTDETQMV